MRCLVGNSWKKQLQMKEEIDYNANIRAAKCSKRHCVRGKDCGGRLVINFTKRPRARARSLYGALETPRG